MRKVLTILVILLLASGAAFAAQTVKNPDTLTQAGTGDVDSLDPAKAYDNVSWSMISLIYDRLIDYDGANLNKFKPALATAVPSTANGGISKDGLTYTFTIRTGVKFQNGYPLTAEDVAYSIRRNMVTDTDAGPDWIWFKVFFGKTSSRDDNGAIAVDFKDILNAVQVKGNTVVFKLAKPFPPFLQVLAGKWASVVSKKWVAEQGGWDGTEATWKSFNNPATGKETLYDIANGSGPYKLVRWEKGVQVSLTRNDAWWGPKCAIKNGVYKVVDEWSTRKLMFLQGDVDIVQVLETNFPEMQTEKGITIYKNLASLDEQGMHFNMNINTKDNPATYSGQLDGQGIPAKFFADKNVRLGFFYAWNEKQFLTEGINDNGRDPVTFMPFGLPYKNTTLEARPFDIKKAEQYFKLAFDGELWNKGFKVDLLFNTGNTSREIGMKMLAENIMSINPKFQINVRGLEWPAFLEARKQKTLPIYFLGWSPDYPDPDNYAFPYMHSAGDFASRQGYNNPEADDLITKAGVELDPVKRQAMYYQLQSIWQQDAITIMAFQNLRQRFVRDWVKGYYYTPMETQEIDLLPVLKKN